MSIPAARPARGPQGPARPSPARQIRRTPLRRPPKIHRGLDGYVDSLRGWMAGRQLPGADELVEWGRQVAEESTRWRRTPADELRGRLRNIGAEFRRLGTRPAAEPLVREALAVLMEAARRSVKLTAHPVQLAGARLLEMGALAEMATGEGKTLVIGLAAAMAGWRGRPVHIVTANDYLVERDAEWLAGFYETCGLDVAHVSGGMDPARRRVAYGSAVVYATSRELVADFLRDQIALGDGIDPARTALRSIDPSRPAPVTVMRGLDTAIIDEADHVLIDEAVTPLIISRQRANSALEKACRAADLLAAQLQKDRDYQVLPRWRDVELNQSGKRRLRELADDLPAAWRGAGRREELVTQALRARELYQRGQQYIVNEEGKLVIVDEFTGRLMPDRTWQQGLHQAVEIQEGLPLTVPTETMARLSFQHFFRLYRRLGGVTGTAREAAAELWRVYRLHVRALPTHHACIRKHIGTHIHRDEDAKWSAVVGQIRSLHERGAPVLVGTRSVEASETLGQHLQQAGLRFSLLNATRHREEAEIIAGAGRAGCITVATNMAGRGTDIRLNHDAMEPGGLQVIGTELHESGRVDRQLFGRAGRQGQPGASCLHASLSDNLAKRFLMKPLQRLVGEMMRLGIPGSRAIAALSLRHAQKRAERHAFRQRRRLLEQDEKREQSLGFTGRRENF